MRTQFKQQYHSLLAAITILLVGLSACGPAEEQPDNNETTPCKEVSVDNEDYCVWRGQNIIIETGYLCPQTFSFKHVFINNPQLATNIIVCSKVMTAPTIPIIGKINAAYSQEYPNNTTGRTCDDIRADYGVTYDTLPTTCTTNADCKFAGINTCGIASKVSNGCDIAIANNADTSALQALNSEYDALGCNANDPVCDACVLQETRCNDQGMCEIATQPARTCDDVRADYAAAYANFPKTCQQASDCTFAGVNSCGLANKLVNGCDIAISTSADTTVLNTLNTEYQNLGCGANDPQCDQCIQLNVTCNPQGMCEVVPQ